MLLILFFLYNFVMSFIKKHKLALLFGFGIIFVYFFTRLYNILELPIFTDEAIYVRWAQIAKNDANWRFISLTDGKQPLLIWLMMIVMRFVEDPLLAGRLVSTVAGFLTMFGLFLLGREMFRQTWVGILSAVLYLIYPMAIVYDRMALYDGLVGTFAVWSLYFAVMLIRKLQLDLALILGMVLGGGVLTKTSGFFNIYLLPTTLVLFDFAQKDRLKQIIKWACLAILATILAYMFYSILRLSPFFHIITEKNAIFVYPLKEWINHPLEFFVGNWQAFWDWIIRYLTWPLLALALLSFFLSKAFTREKIVLFLWFILPILALGLFGRTIYPRFIFFMLLPLLPLIAFSLVNIYTRVKKTYLFAVFCFLFFFLALKADYLILNDFAKAHVPESDVIQYVTGWPAGIGIKESIEFFKKEAKKGKIYIATQGTFGLMPYAFEIYLVDNPNITIEGYWPIGETIPEKVLNEGKKKSAYFVFYQPCGPCEGIGLSPPAWNVETMLQVKRGTDNYTTVYKVR